ncbi:MAG: formimidoylglutamase [Myxococcales bacterium]|nr:formimidoylglutamase [Myxococcales bacterium]
MSVRRSAAPIWHGRSDPEDGPRAFRVYHYVRDSGPTALLGFASDAGVRRNHGRPGAYYGPNELRAALANLAAPANSTTFVDIGNIEVQGDALEAGQAMLGTVVGEALEAHQRVVVLGGGHETAYGSFLGLRIQYPEPRIGIINLDAHLDLRKIGSSGASSGTPFTQIRDLGPERFDYLCIGVADESNTVVLFERAKEWGVRIVSDRALIQNPRAAHDQIGELVKRSDLIYLSIDLDVLPYSQAPGVSAPAPRGVAFSTIESIINEIDYQCRQAKCSLPLVDIVELSPPHDRDHITARSAATLLCPLLFSATRTC